MLTVLSEKPKEPLKPKLLPTPFNNVQSNENVQCPTSFCSPQIHNQGTSAFPPWYNASKIAHYDTTKIEDPTLMGHKWDSLMKPVPLRKFQHERVFHQKIHNQEFYCDTCDRAFGEATSLHSHLAEHSTCNVQGCKFRAHPKIVSLHKKMQHHTGLAKKIMSLDTPEDIQKWREERKRNFPTAENIQKRKEESKDKVSRGEVLKNKQFGRMRGRNNQRGQDNTARETYQEETHGHQNNFRGRGRGRGRGFRSRGGRNRGNYRSQNNSEDFATLKKPNMEYRSTQNSPVNSTETPLLEPFGGTLRNYETELKNVESQGVKRIITNETNSVNCLSSVKKPRTKKTKEELSEGEIEDSDSDQEISDETICIPTDKNMEINVPTPSAKLNVIEEPSKKIESNCAGPRVNFFQDTIESEDEPPEEISSKIVNPEKSTAEPATIKTTGALGSLMQNYGSDSESENDITEVKPKPPTPVKPKMKVKKVPVPNLYPVNRRGTSLLEKLLANEIRHERNVVLQCIHHIVKNNFFDVTDSIKI